MVSTAELVLGRKSNTCDRLSGLTLRPLLAGIAFLLYDGNSVIGWLLTIAGTAVILASSLMNLDIYFRQNDPFQDHPDAGSAVRWARNSGALATQRMISTQP